MMLAFWSFFLVISLFSFAHIDCLHIDRRDINGKLLDCYDYIIVDGGIPGLVVANRLTEGLSVTVLVIEAGDLDDYEGIILKPIDNGDGLGTKYDWNLGTTPQKYIDSQPRAYSMGRGVGGGGLVNGIHELFIQPDTSTHGTDGYVHVSYPRDFYNQFLKLNISGVGNNFQDHPYVGVVYYGIRTIILCKQNSCLSVIAFDFQELYQHDI
ncbi:putative glucose oxidase [Halenospora varia]|nr:putative glucose oxidase [Halenospora varia]